MTNAQYKRLYLAARRTNSSTPLGELFDHGCDAVSTG